MSQGVDGSRPDLDVLAGISLLAASVSAAATAVNPFAHGAWLVAYLFLVGFLAQLLLGRGQAALLSEPARPPARRVRLTQVVLWNLGVVAVPFGVLADARLAVVIGSIALLAALVSFAKSVRHAGPIGGAKGSRLRGAYAALLAFMVISTLVGTALAWDLEWL